MAKVLSRLIFTALATLAVGACTDTDSATNLNPEGPPMLRQVRLNHRVFDAVDPTISFPRRVFAFGTHELANPDEIQPGVTSAIAVNNGLRLIIDEILVGNNLEEIACRAAVDDDAFATVPLGATPDDIARCSVADDVLPSTCTGSTAVCMCNNDAGCARGVLLVGKGEPVGVLDINQDGATDDTRMMPGAIGLRCGTIDVPIDLDNSYWNPSGDQNKPAQGGFDALGPAIVLSPDGPMPTNLSCNLVFANNIVDKQGLHICAPANGDVKAGCADGDLSAFTFKVEPLVLDSSSWENNDIGINRTDPALFSTTAPLDPLNIQGVTVTENGTALPAARFTVSLMMPSLLQITWTGAGLAANAVYVITFAPTITDTFAQGLPAAQTFTFTTGA